MLAHIFIHLSQELKATKNNQKTLKTGSTRRADNLNRKIFRNDATTKHAPNT